MKKEEVAPNKSFSNDKDAKIQKFVELLALRDKLSAPEEIGMEKQLIGHIREEYKLKIEPLARRIESLKEEKDQKVEEVQRPRIETEEKLMNELGRIIHIGNPLASNDFEHRLTEEYVGNLTFGFRREDAVELLKTALGNRVDIDLFLEFCEFSRKTLEYCWEKSGDYNITRQKKSLFPPADILTGPDFRQVDEFYNQGMDILFDTFINQKGNIMQARGLFFKAKEAWEEINDSRISVEHSRALSCFLDFMSSAWVEIFEWPTKEKFRYDFYSIKLK